MGHRPCPQDLENVAWIWVILFFLFLPSLSKYSSVRMSHFLITFLSRRKGVARAMDCRLFKDRNHLSFPLYLRPKRGVCCAPGIERMLAE